MWNRIISGENEAWELYPVGINWLWKVDIHTWMQAETFMWIYKIK